MKANLLFDAHIKDRRPHQCEARVGIRTKILVTNTAPSSVQQLDEYAGAELWVKVILPFVYRMTCLPSGQRDSIIL